jgi:hypothetical protein
MNRGSDVSLVEELGCDDSGGDGWRFEEVLLPALAALLGKLCTIELY